MTLILMSDKIATRSVGNLYGFTGPADYSLLLDFHNAIYRLGLSGARRSVALYEAIACARAGAATVRSDAGAIVDVSSDQPRISYHSGIGKRGLLVENTRNNYLLNSDAPATQTLTLPAAGNYVLWVDGTGSATVTGNVAVSRTATAGAPVEVSVSSPNTVTVTVTGSLLRFQLENALNGPFPTSYIRTVGASATRFRDSVTLHPSAFSEVVNLSAGTIIARGIFPTPISGAATTYGIQHVVRLGKDATAGSVGIEAKYGIPQLQGVVTDNSGAQTIVRINASRPADESSMAVGYASGAASLARGAQVETGAPSALPTGMTRLDIGQSPQSTGLSFNGVITRLVCYRRKLSTEELLAVAGVS